MAYTIIRGGLVLDIAAGTATAGDILIENDTIREIGPPGCPAPAEAREISAASRLIAWCMGVRPKRTNSCRSCIARKRPGLSWQLTSISSIRS